jgi:hypothetical protein
MLTRLLVAFERLLLERKDDWVDRMIDEDERLANSAPGSRVCLY